MGQQCTLRMRTNSRGIEHIWKYRGLRVDYVDDTDIGILAANKIYLCVCVYIYITHMHLVDRLYYFIFIRETSRLGRHILVSVLFWPCLKCNWLIFKWMNGVSLPKMHQCVYYLTSNSCLLSIFFRKKEFNLPPSYN